VSPESRAYFAAKSFARASFAQASSKAFPTKKISLSDARLRLTRGSTIAVSVKIGFVQPTSRS